MATDITQIAQRYAQTLLNDLALVAAPAPPCIHPALRNFQSGVASLTGFIDQAPQLIPAPLASCADGVIAALACFDQGNAVKNIDGAALLGERAAAFGYSRNGAVSASGSCRILPVSDGNVAINLARDADWELIPALLAGECADNWDALAQALRILPAEFVISRGRLLGLAVASTEEASTHRRWFQSKIIASGGDRSASTRREKPPMVLDLSSLWAGPLCSHLLQLLGARVIKIESTQRPDGARFGNADFFNLLNANKECIALDLASNSGREQLRQLMCKADIIIEASRPRALRQMNIFAEEIIRKNPALTWLSITGYGRDEPQANWIAYGDDAAVAAGLSKIIFNAVGETTFCGDAMADPLTGMHAALAAWASYLKGGGELLSLSLRDVVAYCANFECINDAENIRARYRAWLDVVNESGKAAEEPQVRTPISLARALGENTQAILAELNIQC